MKYSVLRNFVIVLVLFTFLFPNHVIAFELEHSDYVIEKGVIKNLEYQEDGSYELEVRCSDQTIKYKIDGDKTVIDAAWSRFVPVNKMKEDQKVAIVVFKNDSKSKGFHHPELIIFNIQENDIVTLTVFEETFTSIDNRFKLVPDLYTLYSDKNGKLDLYKKENVPNYICVMLFSDELKARPTEVTPALLVLLEKYEPIPEQDGFCRLKDAAQEYGYSITWWSDEEPLLLSNSTTNIKISIDNKRYLVNGKKYYLQQAPKLQESFIYIPKELVDTMETYAQ